MNNDLENQRPVPNYWLQILVNSPPETMQQINLNIFIKKRYTFPTNCTGIIMTSTGPITIPTVHVNKYTSCTANSYMVQSFDDNDILCFRRNNPDITICNHNFVTSNYHYLSPAGPITKAMLNILQLTLIHVYTCAQDYNKEVLKVCVKLTRGVFPGYSALTTLKSSSFIML